MKPGDAQPFLNIDEHGGFQAGGPLASTQSQVDERIRQLEKEETSRLVLLFPGSASLESSAWDVGFVDALNQEGTHSLTVLWDTGTFEVLKKNLHIVRSAALAQRILAISLQKLEGAFSSAIGMRGPGEEMSLDEVAAELAGENPFADRSALAREGAAGMDVFAARALEARLQTTLESDLAADSELAQLFEKAASLPLLDESFKQAITVREGERGGIPVAVAAEKITLVLMAVVDRLRKKIDRGLYTTLVEEMLRALFSARFGGWVWHAVQEKARRMWLPDGTEKAGLYLLDRLAALSDPPQLDLIGHSSGSIAICHLLETLAARYPKIKVKNIALLAPACRTDLFFQQIVAHPERFDSLRVFLLQDAFEQQDKVEEGLYPHSLLYLISGALEDQPDTPLVGMSRYLSGEPPYDSQTLLQVRDFLMEAGENRLVLAPTTPGIGPGLRSEARRHNDFIRDPATLESLLHMIRE